MRSPDSLPRWLFESRRERHKDVFQPPPNAWRGAAVGGGLAACALLAGLAIGLDSPLGAHWNLLLMLLGGALLAAAGWALTAGVVALLHRAPAVWFGAVGGALLAALGAGAYTDGWRMGLLATLVLVVPAALLGFAIGLAFDRGFLRRGPVLLLILAVGLWAGPGLWLFAPVPTGPVSVGPAAGTGTNVLPLTGPSPAEPGGFTVRSLQYGPGPATAIQTDPVDASLLLPSWTGLSGRLRSRQWAVTPDRAPLRGQVWYPTGEGPFPLVLLLHGESDASGHGFDALGQLLASRGYIAAAVDMAFLGDSTLSHLGDEAIAARAWLLLQHLEVWQKLNATLGTPFFRRVDMGNIGLVGHSKGGEAAYLAAVFNELPYFPDNAALAFNFRFHIKSVAALAPTDGHYRPAGKLPALHDVNYLLLRGTADTAVLADEGLAQYDRVAFTDGTDRLKAALAVGGANHGQFAAFGGRVDLPGLAGRLVNTGAVLDGDQQRQVARVYVAAFLDATLKGVSEYRTLLRDWRTGAAWLPATEYAGLYTDSSLRAVATFDEDVNVLTTAAAGGFSRGEGLAGWREAALPLRAGLARANTALHLDWSNGGQYSMTIPDHLAREWSLNRGSALTFTAADARQPAPGLEPLDLTVEVIDAAGARGSIALSQVAPLPVGAPAQRLFRLGSLEERWLGPAASVLQTYVIPLRDLMDGTGLNPATLRTVRFTFDRSPAGSIYLDDVGFLERM